MLDLFINIHLAFIRAKDMIEKESMLLILLLNLALLFSGIRRDLKFDLLIAMDIHGVLKPF